MEFYFIVALSSQTCTLSFVDKLDATGFEKAASNVASSLGLPSPKVFRLGSSAVFKSNNTMLKVVNDCIPSAKLILESFLAKSLFNNSLPVLVDDYIFLENNFVVTTSSFTNPTPHCLLV